MFLSLGSILEEKWRQVICEPVCFSRLLHTRKGTFWKAISLSKEKHEWKRMSGGERRSIVPANTFSAQWYTTFRNCKCGRRSINLLVTVVVNEQSLFWFFAEAVATVLPNGVKVGVWDLSQIFQKWKRWFYHLVCMHIEWFWSKNE